MVGSGGICESFELTSDTWGTPVEWFAETSNDKPLGMSIS